MNLSDGTTAVVLTDDLTDEQPVWQPVEQAVSYTLTGAMLVDESEKLAGRPLVFSSDENHGWVPYSAVEQLQRWASQPGKRLTLERYGITGAVLFDRRNGAALEARPVLDMARAPAPGDWYRITLRLMTA